MKLILQTEDALIYYVLLQIKAMSSILFVTLLFTNSFMMNGENAYMP